METSFGCLLYAPQLGTDPTTQACAWWNGTGCLLLCRTTTVRAICNYFLNPHSRICLLILEKRGSGGREKHQFVVLLIDAFIG